MAEPQKFIITVAKYGSATGFSRHWDTPAGLCESQQTHFGFTRPLVEVHTQADEWEDPVVYPDGTGILEFSEMAFYDSGGVEFFWDAQSRETFGTEEPVDQYGCVDHTKEGDPAMTIDYIDIEHSGGTYRVNMLDVADGGDLAVANSSVGHDDSYYIDLWFPSGGNVDNLWGAGDVGLQYEVTVWRPGDEVYVPPDYNQGTKKKNKKNPGGGVPIPEGVYSATQSVKVHKPKEKKKAEKEKPKKPKKPKKGDVIIDIPDDPGPIDLTCFIEGYDFGSDSWYLILAGANITSGPTNQTLSVGPTLPSVANQSANDVLPYLWRIRMEHGDSTEITYSVEYRI